MLDIIESEKPGLLMGVPTMLVGLLEAQAARPRELDSVRMTVSGGAMVPPELVRRVREAFGCGFETVYGQTESSPVVTQTAARRSASRTSARRSGRALPQTEISIRDPASNARRPGRRRSARSARAATA